MLTAPLTECTAHSQPYDELRTPLFFFPFSFQRCLALPAELRCASALLPYSVKYRRCDSPAAACCSLQPQRSVPAVNRAVNPLKMRRCQQATHTRLMTFVGRDFPPHLHCTLRPPRAGCCGSYWKAFRLHILQKGPCQALQRSHRDEWMNEGALIGSASADLYDLFSSSLAIEVVETN